MSVAVALVLAVLASADEPAAPSSGDCGESTWGRLEESSRAPLTLQGYSTRKIARPLTAPPSTVTIELFESVSASFVSSASGPLRIDDLGGALSVSRAFGCRVELGLTTVHGFRPLNPLTSVALNARIGLIPGGVALQLTGRLPVPSPNGSTYGLAAGLPLRYIVHPLVAVVGLDRIVEVYGSSIPVAGTTQSVSALAVSVPVGVMLQPLEALAIEVRARPRLLTLGLTPAMPLSWVRVVDADVQFTYAFNEHVDVVFTEYGSFSAARTALLSGAAVVVRF